MLVPAFKQGLEETGYFDGQNVSIGIYHGRRCSAPAGADASSLNNGRLLGEAGEVVERAGNEPLPAGVLSLGGGGEQLEKIPRARRRFGARRGGGGVEKILQFFLATSQRRLVYLNVMEVAADLGVSLRGHAPVLVEIDRLVRQISVPSRAVPAVPSGEVLPPSTERRRSSVWRIWAF